MCRVCAMLACVCMCDSVRERGYLYGSEGRNRGPITDIGLEEAELL